MSTNIGNVDFTIQAINEASDLWAKIQQQMQTLAAFGMTTSQAMDEAMAALSAATSTWRWAGHVL